MNQKRLYTLTEEQYPVMMLVDEEYLYPKTAQINPIASYLYETDVHGHPINGNVLIIGMNLGGFGTLIASMASLISYRQIAQEETERKGKYFLIFTISNVIFLLILLGVWRMTGVQ